MILYHGTSIVAWESIHASKVLADINKGTELDFGKGFYASYPKDYDYARKHALKTTKDALGRRNLKRNAVVIAFEIDERLFVNKKEFGEKDKEFKDFVFDTRLNCKTENIPFDVVEGPMADGFVDYIMSLYKLFRFDFIKRFVKAMYGLPFNRHKQIVLKTQELCDQIHILEVRDSEGRLLYVQKMEDQSHS